MKKLQTLVVLCAISVLDAQAAMDHSRHSGMGSATCVRPTLSKMQPAHLATVAPGAAFSFVLSNIDDPTQVSVAIKKQPVAVTTEFKDPYYVVSGRIPASLKNTAARVDVKVDSKVVSCRAEEGWLVKISEH
jgi:hypothetical protein